MQMKIYKQVKMTPENPRFKPFHSDNEMRAVELDAIHYIEDAQGFQTTVNIAGSGEPYALPIGEKSTTGSQSQQDSYTKYYFAPYMQGGQVYYACVETTYQCSKQELEQELQALNMSPKKYWGLVDAQVMQQAMQMAQLSQQQKASMDYVTAVSMAPQVRVIRMRTTTSLSSSASEPTNDIDGILGWLLERIRLINSMGIGYGIGAIITALCSIPLLEQGMMFGYNEAFGNLVFANFAAVVGLSIMMAVQYVQKHGDLDKVAQEFDTHCAEHGNKGLWNLITSDEVALVTSAILISTASTVLAAALQPLLGEDLALATLGCTLLANIIFAPMLAKKLKSGFENLIEENISPCVAA